MLSRLATNKLKPILNRNYQHINPSQSVLTKRWSGHNNMDIIPSNFDWKDFKNMVHFYSVLSFIPVIVVTTICNIRCNAELSEVPEGYEPRHWEYYKHPITRWMAKYLFKPMEIEHELNMAKCEMVSETKILSRIERAVDKTMSFYCDHRTKYFHPQHAEKFRESREQTAFGPYSIQSANSSFYEDTYNPDYNPIPTEGFGAQASLVKEGGK